MVQNDINVFKHKNDFVFLVEIQIRVAHLKVEIDYSINCALRSDDQMNFGCQISNSSLNLRIKFKLIFTFMLHSALTLLSF